MQTFKIELEPPELRLLTVMRVQDVRTPRDQVRWLIVQEARRRGLLPATPDPTDDTQPTDTKGAGDDTATA